MLEIEHELLSSNEFALKLIEWNKDAHRDFDIMGRDLYRTKITIGKFCELYEFNTGRLIDGYTYDWFRDVWKVFVKCSE